MVLSSNLDKIESFVCLKVPKDDALFETQFYHKFVPEKITSVNYAWVMRGGVLPRYTHIPAEA